MYAVVFMPQVADVCVEALVCPEASNKVVEIIATTTDPAKPISALFSSVGVW